jgi:hypothetical protein
MFSINILSYFSICLAKISWIYIIPPLSLPSLSSFSVLDFHWDVFLNFRGEDTRKNFVDHLYYALMRAKIHTFRDDKELPRGATISTELINAIRESRIAIVVFSQGYASSTWCLEELVEIVDCRKTRGQTLFPIFYDMEPSDIRRHTGTFAEAFARHEEQFQTDMERVKRWKEALTEAANCSGFDPKSIANGYYAMNSRAFSFIFICYFLLFSFKC